MILFRRGGWGLRRGAGALPPAGAVLPRQLRARGKAPRGGRGRGGLLIIIIIIMVIIIKLQLLLGYYYYYYYCCCYYYYYYYYY